MMAIAIFAASTAVAQEVEHAKFMGIELGGDIDQFESELAKKGFKRTGYDESNGVILYEGGKFTGENVSALSVIRYDVVCAAAVTYKPTTKWHEAKDKYENLKHYLTHKYGNPFQVNEDDWVDFYDISECGNSVASTFEIPGGYVVLAIYAENSYSGAVSLLYADAVSAQLLNQEKLNDL